MVWNGAEAPHLEVQTLPIDDYAALARTSRDQV
jgi:hypothetical protein